MKIIKNKINIYRLKSWCWYDNYIFYRGLSSLPYKFYKFLIILSCAHNGSYEPATQFHLISRRLKSLKRDHFLQGLFFLGIHNIYRFMNHNECFLPLGYQTQNKQMSTTPGRSWRPQILTLTPLHLVCWDAQVAKIGGFRPLTNWLKAFSRGQILLEAASVHYPKFGL